jgi:Domain of unknown function (DUF4402)
MKLRKAVFLSTLCAAMLSPDGVIAAPACKDFKIKFSNIATSLQFASIAPCATAPGSITVRSDNGARVPGGCISGSFGIAMRAKVKLAAGQAKSSNSVSFALAGTGTMKTAGANSIPVKSLNFYPTAGGLPTGKTVTLTGKDAKTFWIGGKANISAAQPAGAYTGSITIIGTCL